MNSPNALIAILPGKIERAKDSLRRDLAGPWLSGCENHEALERKEEKLVEPKIFQISNKQDNDRIEIKKGIGKNKK